jgi:hypothetical protein
MKLGRVGACAGLNISHLTREQEKEVSNTVTRHKTGIYNMTHNGGSTCKLGRIATRARHFAESIF